jgi:hypothetical protein
MGLKMNDARDSVIRQAQQQAKATDTLILQKINASHRIAFAEKFPGQCEHILRLLTERLQAGLDKRDGVIIEDVSTWKLSPTELKELSQALEAVYFVRKDLKAN